MNLSDWLRSWYQRPCPGCRVKIHANAKFCPHCGQGHSGLNHRCTKEGCGELVAWTSSFCTNCQAELKPQLRRTVDCGHWRREKIRRDETREIGVFAYLLRIPNPLRDLRQGVQVDGGVHGCFIVKGRARLGPNEALSPGHTHPFIVIAQTLLGYPQRKLSSIFIAFLYEQLRIGPSQPVTGLVVCNGPVLVPFTSTPAHRLVTSELRQVTATLSLTVHVADLQALWTTFFSKGQDHVPEDALPQWFADSIAAVLREFTLQHDAAQLSSDPHFTASAGQTISEKLQDHFSKCGLQIESIHGLAFRVTAPAAARVVPLGNGWIDTGKLKRDYKPFVGAVMRRIASGESLPVGTAFSASAHGHSGLITNAHVFRDDGDQWFQSPADFYIVFPDGVKYPITAWTIHPDYPLGPGHPAMNVAGPVLGHDLALITVEGTPPASTLRLAATTHVQSLQDQQPLAMLGYPSEGVQRGLNFWDAPDPDPLTGKINRLLKWDLDLARTSEDGRVLEHSIPMTGGVSGGPVFDHTGLVVAVASGMNCVGGIDPVTEGLFRVANPIGINWAQRIDTLLEWQGWRGHLPSQPPAPPVDGTPDLSVVSLALDGPAEWCLNHSTAFTLTFINREHRGTLDLQVSMAVDDKPTNPLCSSQALMAGVSRDHHGLLTLPSLGNHKLTFTVDVQTPAFRQQLRGTWPVKVVTAANAAPSPQPIEWQILNEECLELRGETELDLHLIPIPKGTFWMGAITGDQPDLERDEDAEPEARPVRLTQPCWIASTPFTRRHYRQLTGALPPGDPEDDDAPLVHTSWEDAQALAELLTQREQARRTLPLGFVYRLPTEAEWECACRGGREKEIRYAPGLHGISATADNGKHSGPVGQSVNAWGIHDMLGLVWEHCLDAFMHRPPAADDPLVTASMIDAPDLRDHDGKVYRVIRGGSRDSPGKDARSSTRSIFKLPDRDQPQTKSGRVGFRLVLARPRDEL